MSKFSLICAMCIGMLLAPGTMAQQPPALKVQKDLQKLETMMQKPQAQVVNPPVQGQVMQAPNLSGQFDQLRTAIAELQTDVQTSGARQTKINQATTEVLSSLNSATMDQNNDRLKLLESLKALERRIAALEAKMPGQ